MRASKTALILLAFTSACRCSSAAEWSFCIAPADRENRIYVSRPFVSGGAKAEQEFDETLWARRFEHDSVQCPRADSEAAAVVMHQHAVDANRDLDRQVIDMPWRPLR